LSEVCRQNHEVGEGNFSIAVDVARNCVQCIWPNLMPQYSQGWISAYVALRG
jgi:hypothetical protein